MRMKTDGDKTWVLLVDVSEMENRLVEQARELEAKLQVAVEGLEDAREYHADCLYGIDTLQVLKLEDCTCGICETLRKIKAK